MGIWILGKKKCNFGDFVSSIPFQFCKNYFFKSYRMVITILLYHILVFEEMHFFLLKKCIFYFLVWHKTAFSDKHGVIDIRCSF